MSDPFYRMDERCGYDGGAEEYSRRMTRLTGEFIDQFTTVPDLRTTKQILSRVPKCCIGQPPAPTMEEYKLKPATKKDTSRVRQTRWPKEQKNES